MSIVLFGAGSAGRYALRHLRERGIEPVTFVDSSTNKIGADIEGISVISPTQAYELYPHEEWVCAAISRPAATEIRATIRSFGVKMKPLWECLPVFHENPSQKVQHELIELCADAQSVLALQDLYAFRSSPDYDKQNPPSPISELYFPPFVSHREDEKFVDCGACDGDTVKLFTERWDKWEKVLAIEADPENFKKLFKIQDGAKRIFISHGAVGDYNGVVEFESNGDYSSHIGSSRDSVEVPIATLDRSLYGYNTPTYIKMDIEGAELEALWGARHILKEHSPVLAICAYHTSEHIWQIPLLIHAIQPDYKLYFRRYAEGAWEIVWYAVPAERVIA